MIYQILLTVDGIDMILYDSLMMSINRMSIDCITHMLHWARMDTYMDPSKIS